MNHVAEGTLMTYLDGALSAQDRITVEGHLRACPECASELEELRFMAREFTGALALVDSPIPLLKARAAVEDRSPRPRVVQMTPMRSRSLGRLLKAASITLLIAGGASAAIPGSPLNRLAAQVVELAQRIVFGETPVTVPVPTTVPAEQTPLPTPEFGVSPSNNRVRIAVRGMTDGQRVTVRLVDNVDVKVSAPGSQDPPAIRRGNGFLELSNVASELIIELPRTVGRATVEVNGVPYYVKNGMDVRILQAATETADDEYLFIARS